MKTINKTLTRIEIQNLINELEKDLRTREKPEYLTNIEWDEKIRRDVKDRERIMVYSNGYDL